jgi:hypothetical protein
MAEPGSDQFGGMSEAQRNAIVEALLAQAYQQQAPAAFMGEATAGNPNAWPADPSDPASEASPGDSSSPSPAGLAAISANAQSGNLTSDTVGAPSPSSSPGLSAMTGIVDPGSAITADTSSAKGDFSGNHPGYSPSSFTAAPLGDFTSVNTTVDAVPGAPVDMASVAQNQAAFDQAAMAQSVAQNQSAFDQAAALANSITEGDLATAAPATTAAPAPSNNPGFDVGVGIAAGLSGGFGGATGDGTSGGFGGEAGGPGVGGASTGISGGPGGTGEGGANTGEGGTSSGTSGSSGGDGGAGK